MFRAETEREVQSIDQIIVIRIVIVSAVEWPASIDENGSNDEEQNRNRHQVKPRSRGRLHRVGRTFNSELNLTMAINSCYAPAESFFLNNTLESRFKSPASGFSDRPIPPAR